MYDLCTLEDVYRALTYLDASCSRNDWAKIAMAIKSEFGDKGYDPWNEWSTTSDKYDRDAARTTWKSITGGGGIGIGTLFALAKEQGFAFERHEYSEEEKKAFAREKADRARKREAEAERDTAEKLRRQLQVAEIARLIMNDLKPVGRSEYLGKKRIRSHGARFFHSAVLVVQREKILERVTNRVEINAFFAVPKSERPKFHYFKKGFFAIPLVDADGKLWNLQVITPKGSKLFLRGGRKSGLFSWLGKPDLHKSLILVEGFATGASVYEDTGCPAVVCFDCGNLMPVALKLREKYPTLPLVFAADNDYGTEGNPGVAHATKAAQAVGGAVWVPTLSKEMEEVA
ncbi:PriCT-2 domain-containing protein [uncultured Microbulbifer sp.]|uniref:PriCT-2 domain-containing protein n=1 Tax=uncultured Microbulbifer sp. TaxID=348147 RepID=UPI0026345B80|nr:PriCT-2 domain-containing protein [uncultured Microbulbifer sp.]